MSEAIRIQHCRLRVVRRGGWSWGADPKRLADAATRQLPGLLATLLEDELADCPPGAVIPKLSLRVPVRLGELYRLPAVAEAGAAGPANAGMQRLRAALKASLRDAVPEQTTAARTADDAVTRAERVPGSPTPVIDALCRWQREGALASVLAAADAEALNAWSDGLLAELEAAAQRRAVPWGGLLDPAARLISVRARRDTAKALVVAALVRVVDALTSASCAAARPANGAAAGAAKADVEAAAEDSPRAHSALAQLQALASQRAARHAAAPRRVASTPAARPARVEVESVLPFVVLGVLARAGYLAALAGAAAAGGADDDLAAFGAAVVYKLMPPPRRGWDHDTPTARLAAALCGEAAPPNGACMARFLSRLSAVCAPLDAALWSRSRAARSRSGIVVDSFGATRWSAVELATGQPLGWFASSGALLKLVQAMPQQSWWLAPSAADAALIDLMVESGAKVVSACLPEREAGWLAVTPSWWSNDAALRRHAVRLVATCDDALRTQREHDREFIVRRPLVLRDTGTCGAAEGSITLAVTTALATVASDLWGAREPTTPLLALQRLGDLGGSVVFEQGRLLVRPALGRRFMDLNGHGLLRDIAGVPWLPGRFIAFAGP